MTWNEVKIYTTAEGVDVLTPLLLDLDLGGFMVEDKDDFRAFLNETSPKWDYVDENLMALLKAETSVTLYLPENGQGSETMAALVSRVDRLKKADPKGTYGRLAIETKKIREEDWANAWKQYFKPFEVGEKFVIKPSWEDLIDARGRIVLEIDPGSSFGTGMHETTSLCIALLEDALRTGDQVLDVGTGSGILAIGALLLGARFALGCDIEEQSVSTAKQNAAKNGLSDRFDARRSDLLSGVEGTFDLVTANIVADAVIALLSDLRRVLRPGGTAILSGIIKDRLPDVLSAAGEHGFAVLRREQKNDWAALLLKDPV